jgi:hypothetical protein
MEQLLQQTEQIGSEGLLCRGPFSHYYDQGSLLEVKCFPTEELVVKDKKNNEYSCARYNLKGQIFLLTILVPMVN